MRVDKLTAEEKADYGFIKLTLKDLYALGIRREVKSGLAYNFERGRGRQQWKAVGDRRERR